MAIDTKKIDIIDYELDDILENTSWKSVKQLIHDYKSLRKAASAGGVRIIAKNKHMILTAVKRKCVENESILHDLFSFWFNEQENYYNCLSTYFNSKEHNELLEKRGAADSEYVLNDDYFAKFTRVLSSDDIDKFLLLSPVRFTQEQKDELQKTKKVTTINKRTKPRDKKIVEDKHKHNDRQTLTKGALKHHKKELKKLNESVEKLEKENRRLRSRQKWNTRKREDLQKQLYELETDQSDKINKLSENRLNIEKKCDELENKVKILGKLINEKNNHIRELQTKVIELKEKQENSFHQIISRLDMETLISELNASNDVLELLSNVIRAPTTDEAEKNDEAQLTLKEYWGNLIEKESSIVKKIVEITDEEVADKNYYVDWGDRVDEFNDLKCSLSARIYLSDILYNILQQYYFNEQDSV